MITTFASAGVMAAAAGTRVAGATGDSAPSEVSRATMSATAGLRND
jgi:hypothetical protein